MNMKKGVISLMFCLMAATATAQIPVYEWAGLMPATNYIPNEILSIESDNSGNVYAAGCFGESIDANIGPDEFWLTGNLDVFVQKLGPEGQLKWAKSIGGNGKESIIQSGWAFAPSDVALCVGSNGSVVIADLTTSDSLDLDPGPGISMYYRTPNQNYTKWDTFIVKLDSSGVFQWGHGFGGTENDRIVKVRTDLNGNVIALGAYSGVVDFDPGEGEELLASPTETVFILSLSADGQFNWVKQLVSSDRVFGTGMDIDGNGTIHIAGTFSGTVDFDPGSAIFALNSGNDVANQGQATFHLRLDENGNFQTAKSISAIGGASDQEMYLPLRPILTVNSVGEVLLIGDFYGTIDFNQFGSNQTLSQESTWYPDRFFIKLNVNGSIDWVGQLNNAIQINDADLDDSSIAFFSGYVSQGQLDFDPTTSINLGQYYGAVVASLNDDGSLIWARCLGSSDFGTNSLSYALCRDGNTGLLVSGNLNGPQIDVDPDPDQSIIIQHPPSSGVSPVYLLKWSLQDPVGSENISSDSWPIQISPNPNKGYWNTRLPESDDSRVISTKLWSIDGILLNEQRHVDRREIQNHWFASRGLLIFQVITDQGTYTSKIIID